MNFYVYAHINPATLIPFYIGKGCGERYVSEKGRNKFWKNTVDKYGFAAVKLVDGLSEKESFEIEKQYINKFKKRAEGGSLVNLSDGGVGGFTINDCNRAAFLIKCRDSKLGIKNPNYGKVGTFTGKNHTEDAKAKLRQHRVGKVMSPEVKEKVLKGLKKASINSLIKRTHKVKCLVTGKVWNNRTECANDLGISILAFKKRIFDNKEIKNNYLQLIK